MYKEYKRELNITAKKSGYLKENEEYIHIGTRNSVLKINKNTTQVSGSKAFESVKQNSMIKLKRLDKLLLDSNGNRRPSNLTEFLFGDHNKGYYLLRDNNLK